jgi:L-arabinose isomerase
VRREPIAGLLPLYLKLYDDTFPGLRREFEPFLRSIADGLAAEGVRAERSEICRLEAECAEAVGRLDAKDVDLLVTVHLAYSPSCEAAGPLAASHRPLLLLDATMDFDFGRSVDPARIMYNHGIHGVQDLACVLRRRGRPYEIVAGHVTRSSAIQRAAEIARAALAARILRETRALRIGPPFQGMGDFHVKTEILRKALGVSTDEASPEELAPLAAAVTDDEVAREMREDRARFRVQIDEEVHRRSTRLGLALRRLVDERGCNAFSMNFMAFGSREGPVSTVPFLEASKAMARGLGYAGEGDVLTASLVAALNGAFGRTTFTEIFCPDWKGGALFLSHMGEINPEVAAEKPRLCGKDFPWTGAHDPAVITCAPAPGPAALVNLAPGPGDSFSLIVAPVTMLGDATSAEMRDSIRGWAKPSVPLEEFLERYSTLGGTHHSALVLGERAEGIAAFGRFAGIPTTVIGRGGA